MSVPPEVPTPAAEPAPAPPPRGLRNVSWGRVAEVCGGAGVVLFMAWGVCFEISREGLIALGVVLAPLVLLGVFLRLFGGRFSDAYPPPAPGTRWAVRLPGLSFGFVFAVAACALSYAGLFVVREASDRGVRWGPWGLAAVAAVGLGAAAALGRALRTRPELEVDEGRRELYWRPNAPWAGPVTLPFDAVADVRVVYGKYYQADPYAEIYRPEITWRAAAGRLRTTRLPLSTDRAGVEGIATRLRGAVLGPAAGPAAVVDCRRQS